MKVRNKIHYTIKHQVTGEYIIGFHDTDKLQPSGRTQYIPVYGRHVRIWRTLNSLRNELRKMDLHSNFFTNCVIIQNKKVVTTETFVTPLSRMKTLTHEMDLFNRLEHVHYSISDFVQNTYDSFDYNNFRYIIKLKKGEISRFSEIRKHLKNIGTLKGNYRYQKGFAIFKNESDVISLKITFGEFIEIIYDYQYDIMLMDVSDSENDY